MNFVLSERLPSELVDMIAKEVHRLNFKGCLSQIKYCVVKIYSDGDYGFITSNNHNYYECLDENDDLMIEVINKGYKNAIADNKKFNKQGEKIDGSIQV